MSQANGPTRPKLWQQPGGRPGEPAASRPRQRRQLYVALALLAALAGATAAWLCYPDPVARASFLGVWIDQYGAGIPPNPWAARDRTALKGLPWEQINAFSSQERRLLKDVLHELRKPSEYPLVVLLSAHAVSRPDGSVHLLPGDARLEDETGWLPLSEVLDALRSCGARRKLLILDIMHPLTAPRLGILRDDVPDRVQAALEAAVRADPDLHVLWACAPGQHSLPAGELGHSAFAYYLREGLQGHADGYAAGKAGAADGRVSVRELARFVQARVDRWSEATRQVRQTPQFLSSGDDFPLLSVREPPGAPAPLADAAPYPKWLHANWQKRDDWLKEPWPRVPPELLRALEDVLLRAERRLRAGLDAARVKGITEERVRELRERRGRWRESRRPQGRPLLARASARGEPPPDLTAATTKYRELLELAQKVEAAPKPEDKDRQAFAAARAALLKEFTGKPFALAVLAVAQLGKDPQPTQAHVRLAAGLLAAVPHDPPYEEAAFVQRLAAWKVQPKDWPGASVRLALRLVRKAADAEALADDARLLPWVAESLKTARGRATAAQQLLFEPGETPPADGKGGLTAALRSNEALAEQLENLAGAFRARDDALVRLPGYVRRLEWEPGEEAPWQRAVDATLELEAELRRPPGAGKGAAAEAVRKLGKLAETLRDELSETVQSRVKDRARTLIDKRDKAGPADWLPMNALLQTPWLEAGERAALWAAERDLARRLTRQALAKDAQEDAAGQQTPAPRAVEKADVAAHARRQALLRARVSLDLLRLAGAADLEGVSDALARASMGETTSPEQWRALSAHLRQAWAALKAAEESKVQKDE